MEISFFTIKTKIMLIGYSRVSTFDQNLDLQNDALIKAECEKIFSDNISGTIAKREGLEKLKEQLRKGDTLIVWRLDRLGRSLKDLIDWMTYLDTEGISFKSLQENIDTATSTGKLFFHIFGAFAEFERNLIVERTNAGLATARARGRLGGRPKTLDADEQKTIVELYNKRELSIEKLCKMFKISKPTLYKYVNAQ